MQSDAEPRRRSPRPLTSPAAEILAEKVEKSKNYGGRRGALLLLASPEMRRRSPRLCKEGDVGSSLLALPDSSEKKACRMIVKQLLGSSETRRSSPRLRKEGNNVPSCLIALPDWSEKKACEMIRSLGVLIDTRLRSGRIPYQNSPNETWGKKRKRTLDSCTSLGLSEKSTVRKNGKRCTEEDRSANSCSKGIANGVENGNVPMSTEEEGDMLQGSPGSRKVDMLSEAAAVSASAINPEKEEMPSKEEEDVQEYKRCFFIGESVPDAEARQSWPRRYETKSTRFKGRSMTTDDDEEDELELNVDCHYAQAQINECVLELGDCAYMRGEKGQRHIGRIVELFRTKCEEDYCRVQWFYKAEDTVMKGQSSFHDKKRLFYSIIMNDNPLDCVISKLKVVQVTHKSNLRPNLSLAHDYYYDMEYCLDYSTFRTMPADGRDLPSACYNSSIVSISNTIWSEDSIEISALCNRELSLLDLYSGCGAMSTGLCLGAKMSGVDLVKRWAVDSDSYACESLRMNHPNTQVRNENAEDFLELLRQWEKLCKRYVDDDGKKRQSSTRKPIGEDSKDDNPVSDGEEFEVERLLEVCCGDPDKSGKKGLKFKVRWKGYGPDEDTWEPIDGLKYCQEHVRNFVINGFKAKILPLPGGADVVCGGPPCQGISGYNRFRSVNDPFDDDRNHQLVVFMDIVKFLKPKYILMENVMDILRFNKGSLGRYALSRLVHMNYQARIGIMAAGCYGLPQFRLRVFFWGAHPTEDLPQFPLPTHDVILRYWPPPEFERNVVAYNEGQSHHLQDAVLLRDALSDLPPVGNDASADEMPYGNPPETEFQQYVRTSKCDTMSSTATPQETLLYDHRPFPLHEDDYIRVCHVPRRKGANFRDLPGIVVGDDNVVRRDPKCENAFLPSGKPMVPDYALTFEQGKSKRPFARLWWDETMPTVVTTPTCHSQAILHPEQDRSLTVRECARLQGFPDHYRFAGTVKKRYRQIGNAVPIPVAKALGYALGMASQKLIGKEPIFELPPNFTYSYSL